MSPYERTQNDKTMNQTFVLLEKVFSSEVTEKVGIRLWNGTSWPDDKKRPAMIVLKHPGALRNMFLPGNEVGLGEAYLRDDFDIEGDIETVFEIVETLTQKAARGLRNLEIAWGLLRLPGGNKKTSAKRNRARLTGKPHSLERDRQAIAYHYNVSNQFFALWLDKNLVYSCAYFISPDDDLDTAQDQKLDYICRKLRLKPKQRLLDVGCGWGGLVMHAAKHYKVDATGITLSQPQADLANKRIEKVGLVDQCRVYVQDYRQTASFEEYDALVSVGMFEHVGASLLSTYFSQAFQLLKPGGVFLNHGIAKRATDKPRREPTFSETYVFPDGEVVPIHVTLRAAEKAGFEVRDVESLREHYALTLRNWVDRLETNHEQAIQFVKESTYRIWRLFMSGSAYGFSTGFNNVYQTLLVKPNERGKSGLPLTRRDWYGNPYN
jgi:cyclopropane-fatty-acyl-phospholipid synthase